MIEYEIQTAVNKTLKQLKIPYYHLEKGKTVHRAHSKGFPDIIFLFKGKLFMFEIKKKGGIVSPAQKAFLSEWHASGAVTHVIYSYDEFIAILKIYDIIK